MQRASEIHLPRLRDVRRAQFMTETELSERTGVSRQTINRIEAGQMATRFATARKIAEALGVPPSALAESIGGCS